MKDETIIISLGGSLVVPNEIDVGFLRGFKNLILEEIKRGRRFFIIVGGGRTCRNYQKAAQEISEVSNEELDWIGIASLKLNAELVRVIFGENAHGRVVDNLSEKLSFEKPIIIGAAYKPGNSTDWDAVLAAQNVGAKKIINLSNTDYVYDSDPKKNPNAKKIEELSWADYRKLIPKEWNPGLNTPFDPVASEMAEKEKIEVIIMNGKPIKNFAKCLNGEKFLGTVIR